MIDPRRWERYGGADDGRIGDLGGARWTGTSEANDDVGQEAGGRC